MTLIDLIESYGVSLDSSGMEWKTRCPFHEDSDPSFTVSEKDGGYVWYCFGCKLGGGPVQFISYMNHISYREAQKQWDRLNGKKVEQENILLWKLTEFFHEEATQSERFTSYVYHERGVNWETIEKYKLGYCESWEKTVRLFNITADDSDRWGLWDMTDCVVFPFFDGGLPFQFHARAIGEKAYKWKKGDNSRRSLWGLEHTTGPVFLVEGFFDVLALSAQGYNAVSMCGSNMFEEYWNQLRERNLREIVFIPDGDDAGRRLLVHVLSNIPSDFSVEYIGLPIGDPDEWSGDLPAPLHPLRWYIEWKWKEVYSLEERIKVVGDITKYYLKLSRPEQELFKEYFQKQYGEAVDYLYSDIKPNIRAEELVLGNCLVSTDARLEATRILNSECFHPRHFREIFEFINTNDNPTPHLVKSYFDLELEIDLLNYSEYIQEVRKVFVLQKVCDLLHRSISNIQGDLSVESVGRFMEELYLLIDDRVGVISVDDIVRKVTKEINTRVEDPQYVGVPFSEDFPSLNRSLLGYVPGKLILLSGITGHGKTNVTCNWVDDLVFEKDQKVLYVSLEMSPEELIERQLTIRSGITGAKIATGSLEQSEYNEVLRVAESFLKKKLWVVHGIYDLQRLVGIMKSQILRNGVRVVFLDYVQLATVGNRKDRWEQLMDITKTLKTQVCSAGVTVIAVSQLRRSAINSAIPEASEQAGSFGMLCDADVAITIKRKTGDDVKEGSNFLLYVDKHRYGIDNVLVDAVFDKQTLRIREC